MRLQDKQYLRTRRNQFLAQGLCRECGAYADGFTRCYEHRRRERIRLREKRKRK